MLPFLDGPRAPRHRHLLFAAMGALVLGAVGLVVVKAVVLKMLPFDNKSEFQVVVDMPEGSTLERTNRLLGELRSEEHTSELQSLMRISYAVFCLKKKTNKLKGN